MTINNKQRLKHITIIFFLFIIWILLELHRSSHCLEITHYQISADNTGASQATMQEDETSPPSDLRILQLTDLHDSVFGEENEKLINMVKQEEPDIIILTGDLVNNKKQVGTSQAVSLIVKLVEIAPVYASLGNQEKSLIEQGIDVVEEYRQAGAIVLDDSYLDVEIKGKLYRIGGIYGYCQPMPYSMESKRYDELEYMIDFQNTDAYKILLCHMPVCWVDSYSLYDYDVDLVFAGHAHGGQIRFPGIGGLWAPDQGWFPGDECGIYTTTEEEWYDSRRKLLEFAKNAGYDTSYYESHREYHPSFLVLSRGLGNTDFVPRFNNVPEVVVVELVVTDG